MTTSADRLAAAEERLRGYITLAMHGEYATVAEVIDSDEDHAALATVAVMFSSALWRSYTASQGKDQVDAWRRFCAGAAISDL